MKVLIFVYKVKHYSGICEANRISKQFNLWGWAPCMMDILWDTFVYFSSRLWIFGNETTTSELKAKIKLIRFINNSYLLSRTFTNIKRSSCCLIQKIILFATHFSKLLPLLSQMCLSSTSPDSLLLIMKKEINLCNKILHCNLIICHCYVRHIVQFLSQRLPQINFAIFTFFIARSRNKCFFGAERNSMVKTIILYTYKHLTFFIWLVHLIF